MRERTYNCATCNTPFSHGNVGRPPKDCPSCRDVGTYVCDTCGRSVEYVRSHAAHKRCKDCRVRTGRCSQCGAETRRVAVSGPAPSFCSRDCERASNTERKRLYMARPEVRQRVRDRERSDLFCKDCGQEIPFEGKMRRARCIPCGAAHEARRLAEKNWRKQGIRLDVDDYLLLYESQAGCCAICGRAESRLHVDHCHVRGEVRALLCGNCNRGLGMFGDEPARLIAAAAYLERTTVNA